MLSHYVSLLLISEAVAKATDSNDGTANTSDVFTKGKATTSEAVEAVAGGAGGAVGKGVGEGGGVGGERGNNGGAEDDDDEELLEIIRESETEGKAVFILNTMRIILNTMRIILNTIRIILNTMRIILNYHIFHESDIINTMLITKMTN